jgi:serine/threonine protein kinase/HEAT repeat protein
VDSTPTIELRRHNGAPRGKVDGGSGTDPFIGQELCGYLIRRKLAEGGMGVVYEGVHRKIGRLGAIKILKPELCRSDNMVERFYLEARAVNAIRHENIVDIYDFGRDPSGRVFFVMEYLEGEPLSARIHRGSLTWSEAFPILDHTLRALKAAHDKGFVHRDLKPDNLWLQQVDGRVQVKLLDFGIAKLIDAGPAVGNVTRTGSVTGTAHYMSPEQINGARDVDQRTDVYAMGVITYEMFAGVTPFVGDTLHAILAGHLFQDPPRLDDLPGELDVPVQIAEVVDQMLVKDPAGRYRSVADVLADLHDIHARRSLATADTRNQRRAMHSSAKIIAPHQLRSRRIRAILLSALAAGVLGGAALAVLLQSPAGLPSTRPVSPPEGRPPDYDGLRDQAHGRLHEALGRPEPAVRRDAADALGKVKDPASESMLIGLSEHDADDQVRGQAADALGAIEVATLQSMRPSANLTTKSATVGTGESIAQVLTRLDERSQGLLHVSYTSALARLGNVPAVARLLDCAHDNDPAVSFKAALALSEISPPRDVNVIGALRALLGHKAVYRLEPHAGIRILARMAALHDRDARDQLYMTVDDKNENEATRFTAADSLVTQLGDDQGRKLLQDVVADQASPNRLGAAVALIALGEYDHFELILSRRGDSDPKIRRLVARGLGEIGEPKSLEALSVLINDKDWIVRIAAAVAIIAVVELDPKALEQESTTWPTAGLASPNDATRAEVAGVLSDLPSSDAISLLARAIADDNPDVRREASNSAGRMKSTEAAKQLVQRVEIETDPSVKEQQIKALGALGTLGGTAAHEALTRLAKTPGRLGVIAAGSLIAVGDASGKAKLDAAIASSANELRLAAVQAAVAASDPVLVPTLKLGATDRWFEVRFAAALGLAMLRTEKTLAVQVLRPVVKSNDIARIGQAAAALIHLGEDVNGTTLLKTLRDSDDPTARLAAILIARELSAIDETSLLRRLVADLDQEVRRASVAAIEDLATNNRDEAIKLYKRLLGNADPVVRTKAAGQLSRLLPPPLKLASSATPPPPAPPDISSVRRALDEVIATAGESRVAVAAFEALAADLATAIAVPAADDNAIQRVDELSAKLDKAAAELEATAAKAEAAARAASDAADANPSSPAAELVAQARALAQAVQADASSSRSKAGDGRDKARTYIKAETGNVHVYIAKADVDTMAGRFDAAQHGLDRAAKLIRASGSKNASLDFSYAQLYDQRAIRALDPADKRKWWEHAQDRYHRFAEAGTGPRVQQAEQRATEIADLIKQLGVP